ncbi:polyketide synthase family protein [Cylindrospermum stagnale PCC 7417]|uniref:Phenolphthiocerol/phthiocerol polyketide synthase subunit E n=1 Tax=Cylindrospermum stagnale PCC 7417 TaxID=56107 RepID=K9WUC0_9NOST|nr:type I polyketide synthase [Cylindrospermum stagnale]AFZ23803.1 polyketide synthase family protein [Cylindrospermum stagnale PCC 7417]
MDSEKTYNSVTKIAIIGIAGRFPGAKNITEFWHNLCDGVESISRLSDEELIAAGVDLALLDNPNYVKAGAVLEDTDLFDAGFFSFNPKEAEMTDPQHRIFLECAWEALENAGYDCQRCESQIGVYAGASLNNYLSFNLNRDQIGSANSFQKLIGNDKDFLTTRVSYKLNLTGPSLTVQTACSTSLVATVLACQSLLNYQCDMALAGGASIRVPQKTGYLHQEGGILSPDGHCRAFDAKAQGTIIGNGVGVVVLKRLADAIADHDHIYAVIKGSAINNDGSAKVGYTAPSVNGQANAIAEAIALAEVEPESISYIEAHGTGTNLGDPIEISALTNVFRAETQKTGFCAVGSVKTNIGHLDAASGVTGLIKTALALQHKLIPPSLNFEKPNPEIDFDNSPFYVNTKLKEWNSTSTPRRAGVSSLGIGGTNAHVILEEAPFVKTAEKQKRNYHLLVLSAKTDSALEKLTQNLAQHLKQNPDLNLADVAYTLQVGRGVFNYRRMVVCQNIQEVITALETTDNQQVLTHFQEPTQRSITFMFPGQGAQYVEMAQELYQTVSKFREEVDHCCLLLKPYLGLDLSTVIYPKESEKQAAAEQLKQTDLAQPALFVIEYALAQLWMSWGILPQAMIGHSIGEYVAACLAGVMSVEDALALVAIRGQLMRKMPTGAMLSISAPAAEIKDLLNENLALAASNAPSLCVVSGNHKAVDIIAEKLTAKGIEYRRLHTSHAFHSQMMEPMLEAFIAEVKKVKLNPPQIPFISNLTGTWITVQEATNPNYWVQHLRQTVQFSAGLSVLLQTTEGILLEVGPGRTLCTLVKQHTQEAAGQVVLPSLRHSQEEKSDVDFLVNILGRLWLAGVEVNWSSFYNYQQPYRVPLPTYPFERQRYWIAPETENKVTSKLGEKPNITDWFYIPSWKRFPQLPTKNITSGCYLFFVDECGVGLQIIRQLQQLGYDIIAIEASEQFNQLNSNTYTINPAKADDYQNLLRQLGEQGKIPQTIIHLWSITQSETLSWETTQDLGFYSLVYLAQAIGQQQLSNAIKLLVIANHLYEITGSEKLSPEKATILGACKVIPQEYPHISCRLVDVLLPTSANKDFVEQLLAELTDESESPIIAYRGNYRWVQTFEPILLEKPAEDKIRFRQGGVYLITGGMGGIGLVLAEYLAKTVQAKLVLLGRSLPSEDSPQMEKVRQLEAFGAQVLVLAADVTNQQQMQNAIAQALESFKEIHGVIHTAGIPGGGMIQLKTPEIAESVFAPKIQGTLILNNVLKDINLDFLVLASSLSSIQGGFGQVDYCAANAFLDAFAHWNTSINSRFTVAINWDAWQEVGMAANTIVPDELKKWREESLKNAILPEEGVDAFSRILANSLPQVVVSTQDLQTSIEQINKLGLPQKSVKSSQLSATRHTRTLQASTYIAPRNQTEEIIANIWQELIGIEKVGIYDNFFELGGHSLLAVQTISRLRENFQVELPLRTLLFDAPTIADLATVIVEKKSPSEELDDLAQLLAEVENLSLEELQKQLVQESAISYNPS